MNYDTLVAKHEIINKLKLCGYQCESYDLGIKVHLDDSRYIDISRLPNYELSLDVYLNGKLDPNSLDILEDRGRIRASSLLNVIQAVSGRV